jgi:predicted nucleic acid-binding protein
VLYLDSSAIVKLVILEPETADLVEMVRTDPSLISSALAWTEVVRAVRRAHGSVARATRVLGGIALVPVDDGLVRSAAMLSPTTMRTPEAIHVATALSLGADVSRLVTYDGRLGQAAARAGIEVTAPGAPGS